MAIRIFLVGTQSKGLKRSLVQNSTPTFAGRLGFRRNDLCSHHEARRKPNLPRTGFRYQNALVTGKPQCTAALGDMLSTTTPDKISATPMKVAVSVIRLEHCRRCQVRHTFERYQVARPALSLGRD